MNKHLQKTFFILVFLTAVSAEAFNVDTLYLCRKDGIRYQNVTTQGKAIAWLWSFEKGSDANGSDFISSTDSAPPPVYYNTAGIFKTTIKTTFSTGADSTDDVFVVVRDWPMPAFYFPKDTGFCAGNMPQITLSTTSYLGLNYQWSTGASGSSIVISQPGNYSVTLQIRAGSDVCEEVIKDITVTEYPSPSVNLGPDKYMCQNQLIPIDAGGMAGDQYVWSPDGETSAIIKVSLPGIYKVIVTNPQGCIAEDEVEMIDSCPHYVFIPDAVSPNEDNMNDLFIKVWNFTPKDYTFRIFNRWGELLYETNDLNAGWDCKVNYQLVQQDIYMYKLTYTDNDKKWYEIRGTFFVAR